jgi:cytochrome c oxidase subunit 2
VDHLYFFLLIVSTFFTVGIFLVILFFCVRYRRSKHPIAEQTQEHPGLEILWTAIPMMLTFVMFVWGANIYIDGNTPPADAENIFVVGKQWMWKVQHLEGRREINELHIPVNKSIKLTLTSEDVIHSFYVPEFRVKQDAVPGTYRTLWFQPDRTGTFHLFCAEFCGTDHSKMIGRIIVMEPGEYEAWLAGANDLQPVQAGEKLFTQFDCVNCHGTGARQRCPPLGGLFGTYVPLADGTRVLFDEGYIRESILDPNAKIAAGYKPIMPTFKGQLTEEQIIDLIQYLKSLSLVKVAPEKKP